LVKLREVMDFWNELAKSDLEDRAAIGAPKSTQFIDVDIRGDLILDVGVGYGRYAIPLANKGKFVVGIDVSLNMLYRLRRYCNDVHAILASGTHLPFRDEVFDAAISLATLYYIPGWEHVVREVARTLKRGGAAKMDFRGFSLRNILREIILRSLKRIGIKRPWLYAVENRLTTQQYLTKILKENSLVVKSIKGDKTRFLVEVTKC